MNVKIFTLPEFKKDKMINYPTQDKYSIADILVNNAVSQHFNDLANLEEDKFHDFGQKEFYGQESNLKVLEKLEKIDKVEERGYSEQHVKKMEEQSYLKAEYEVSGKYLKDIEILKNEIVEINKKLDLQNIIAKSFAEIDQIANTRVEETFKDVIEVIKLILSKVTEKFRNELTASFSKIIENVINSSKSDEIIILRAHSIYGEKISKLIEEQVKDVNIKNRLKLEFSNFVAENDMIFITKEGEFHYNKLEVIQEIDNILTEYDKIL